MNFLRPVYTDYLFKQLQKQSLNVYGDAGQGKERLLVDLQALAKPAGILVLSANMKAFAKNYAGFIKDLTRQLASQLQVENSALSLEQLLDRSQPKTVWILLDHFDAVLDRTELDPQFGIAFFDQLNALKNRPRCFLLCVTEKPYQKYHLYAEQIHRLSRLDLGVDKLTALTRDECEQELQRRVLGLPDEHFQLLLPAVYQHSLSYDFLEYACNRIAAGAEKSKPFKNRLEIWQKDFKTEHKETVLGELGNFQNKVSIVTRWLKSLSATMKALLGAITAFAILVAIFFEKIVQFFESILQLGK